MVELLRNQQSMNRMGQPAGDFNGAPPHMPGLGMQGAHQQFHDQQGQQQQQHPHMPNSGFPSSVGGPHNPMHAASLNNRAAMINALQNGQVPNAHQRQLELMNLAQNQQNQNSPINVNRMMPPGQMQGQPMGNQGAMNGTDFFPPNGMAPDGTIRRNSPHPPIPPNVNPMMAHNAMQQPNMMQANGQIGGNARSPLNAAEIMNRIASNQQALKQVEAQIKNLQASRAGTSDQQFLERMRQLQSEGQVKREFMHKLYNAYKAVTG
jgi:hypothetical protein